MKSLEHEISEAFCLLAENDLTDSQKEKILALARREDMARAIRACGGFSEFFTSIERELFCLRRRGAFWAVSAAVCLFALLAFVFFSRGAQKVSERPPAETMSYASDGRCALYSNGSELVPVISAEWTWSPGFEASLAALEVDEYFSENDGKILVYEADASAENPK